MVVALNRYARCGLAAIIVVAMLLVCSATTLGADVVTLKSGETLEGEITRQGEGYLYIRLTIGGTSIDRFITSDQVASIERDMDAAAEPAEDGASEQADHSSGDATRIAILNFGPPDEWGGEVDSMVGVIISAKAFEEVIPMLEKAQTDVVVIRVNSGGGYGLEVDKFHELFVNEYKPRWRTVAWIESAISAAAMSPYVLEEMYFMPEGNLGACTGWYGPLIAVEGYELQKSLQQMETASRVGGRDPKIMRSMQIDEPLSCDIDDETGKVTWYQSTEGQYLVNEPGKILTFNSRDALKYGFAQGVADSKDELAEAMGYEEVQWVAQNATKHVDDFMREAHRTEQRFLEITQKYLMAVEVAEGLAPKTKQRGAQIAIARRYLREMQRQVELNPNFEFHLGQEVGVLLTAEWFELQFEYLDELADPR